MISSTGAGLSGHRRFSTNNGFGKVLLWSAAGFFIGLAIWRYTWNVIVLSYGPPSATFFQPETAKPGGQVLLWLTRVQWHRRWPSTLHVRVVCRVADPADQSNTIDGRIDLEPHIIDVPKEIGPLPPKSRPFTVPPQCQPGQLTWTATAVSYGGLWGSWNPRYAEPPELHLMVK